MLWLEDGTIPRSLDVKTEQCVLTQHALLIIEGNSEQ